MLCLIKLLKLGLDYIIHLRFVIKVSRICKGHLILFNISIIGIILLNLNSLEISGFIAGLDVDFIVLIFNSPIIVAYEVAP